jgi:hypothetical protein
MDMKAIRLACALIVLALGGVTTSLAQPALTYAAEVQVSTGGNGPVNLQFAFDGGEGATSAFQEMDRNGGDALSRASVTLEQGGYVPTLRAQATANPTHAQAVAWGVQSYRNTSASPLPVTLSLDLSANITGSNDIEARVYLFQESGFEFYKDSGTMLFESSSQLWEGFESYANNLGPDGFDIDINNYTGAVNEQRQFEFTVDPGEAFYVWARLVTTADNPGESDAFSTLTASLSNIQGLTPTVVPEPGTLFLMLLGGVAVLARVRRR